jgi:LuxR family maltose regulon positive regulatory protein
MTARLAGTTGQTGRPTGDDDQPVIVRASPAFPIRSSKLRPIVPRLGAVDRQALLDRLQASRASVITVIAPAGYGKTTLLAQVANASPVPVAWLSADDSDNDPAALCTYLVAALDRVEPVEARVFAALGSNRPPSALLTQVLVAMEATVNPVTLVIDQLESVSNPECLDLVERIASRLPDGVRLIVSSRMRPRLPVARLRVEGRLLEIGVQDLALDVDGANELFVATGIGRTLTQVRELVERTEGWPAGLYLAALAMQVGAPQDERARRLRGDSRFLGDYLRAEVLDRLSADEATFLTRTSILESLSGPLCDATLDERGSSARLAVIEDRNLLVVPLDDRRDSYRFHRLFGELLRSELHRREPDLVPRLHARAAVWYQDNGQPEAALRHAQDAKDVDRAARLLEELVQPVWASGRAGTVLRWLEWLADQHVLDRYPALAVHGALMYALLGQPAHAEAWTAAAERSQVTARLPDGSSVESMLAYLRAFLCRDGVAAMRTDSIVSFEGMGASSRYRASMLFNEGMSHLVEGDPDRGEPVLQRSFDAAEAIASAPLAAMALSQLSTIAGDRDDWEEATELGNRALALVAGGSFDEYWSSAPVFAWGARIALHAGRVDLAQSRLVRAARLRPLLTYALPVMSVVTLLDMARVYAALSDTAGASTVLRQARGILQQRPDLGLLGGRAEDLRIELTSAAEALAGGSSLTAAELRLAPLLATRLTLQEIGDRLYIARSTAKTHAVSIYRKLGVSTRREAVDKLCELRLIVL